MEDAVESFETLARLAASRHLQPAGGQHRRQREADEQRHHDRERHGQPEALHEAPDDPAHESHRDENRHQRERRGEHRQADFLRRIDGGTELVFAFLFDEPIDVLQHHDGVVDDDTDGEGEGQHGHRIQREAHVPDQAERRDDRRRNGNGRDDGGSQVGQEDEDDERREEGANDEMLFNAVDRSLDEFGTVLHDPCVITGRQRAP